MNINSEITVSRTSSQEERKVALHQIYQQVLERQPYAFERKILAKAEKDFLNDKIGVKRFLKILGHSEVYLNEFYYRSSNLKFLELSFKHFIGRAPINHDELHEYSDVLMCKGVYEVITRMIDSEEYRKRFGCFTVPHPYTESVYDSPKAYLENEILSHELHGRRGFIVPTMVWHELGIACDGHECTLPTKRYNEIAAPKRTAPDHAETDRLELLQMMRRMTAEDLQKVVRALPREQKEVLSQALLQLQRR